MRQAGTKAVALFKGSTEWVADYHDKGWVLLRLDVLEGRRWARSLCAHLGKVLKKA
jgi:hypothetical protein